MQKIKGIIFDLDGTLVNTLEDIANAENKALTEIGLQTLPTEEFRWIVGGGAENIAQRLLPQSQQSEDNVRAFVDRFRGFYSHNLYDKTKLYNGILELLDALKQKNIPMAILSNKPEEFTLRIVDYFFPEQSSFTHVYGQISGIPTKPNPILAKRIAQDWNIALRDIGFLGDSDIDVYTADNAGMISLGAEWGFRGKEELIASGVQILLKHPLELLKYLD